MTATVVVLPDPPGDLPAAPRAFYDGLRALVAAVRPTDVDGAHMEVDFGDSGVAVTLPHVREPDWTVAAQVSRAAAVVFAGPVSEHFDAGSAGPQWTDAAVALVGRALRGELEVPVAMRGNHVVRVGAERLWSPAALAIWRPLRTEVVRVDFGARGG